MKSDCKTIFDRCNEYLDEAMKAYDLGLKSIPVALQMAAASRIAQMRIAYRGGLRDAYLTAVWETLMGHELPWNDGDPWDDATWAAEIQAALDNRFS